MCDDHPELRVGEEPPGTGMRTISPVHIVDAHGHEMMQVSFFGSRSQIKVAITVESIRVGIELRVSHDLRRGAHNVGSCRDHLAVVEDHVLHSFAIEPCDAKRIQALRFFKEGIEELEPWNAALIET